MRYLRVIPMALLASASTLTAQSWKESMVRMGPQSYSYKIKTPVNETVSELAFPIFVSVPVLPALRIDVGTAYATARYERRINDSTTTTSQMNGLTDTQLRANYSLGQDFVVLTAGLNLPTGSATVSPTELDAATRIGSDFLMFPISGFGSGFGMTGGVAIAKPLGAWNVGFATSVRQSSEYEPFKDANDSVTTFDPGMEIRTRFNVDHPFGTGRVSAGFTFSKFGDDKANAATFNTGNRILGQIVVNSSLKSGTDYTLVLWNLYRSSGTLINNSPSPSGNITNAMMAFGIRGPADVGIEPSVEAKVFTQQNARTSFLANMGLRFYINRGSWAAVPGFGFTFGQMDAGPTSATVTGMRATLAVRVGT
jgi:hypothetical protein